jgi:hypothetical protein
MARTSLRPYTSVSNCSTFGLLRLCRISAIVRIVTGTLVPAVDEGAKQAGAVRDERSIHGSRENWFFSWGERFRHRRMRSVRFVSAD